MKDGKPETLEEAIAIIEEQQNRLSEKDKSLREKDRCLQEKDRRLQEKENELIEKIAEIKLLNEKLSVRRAREFLAKCEKASRLLADQLLLFDAEELNIQISNPCPSPSDEEIAQSEDSEKNPAETKPKKSKGRKSLSSMNNLAKKRIVIDPTDEEKICPNCGTRMEKVNAVESERIVHVPAYEYIEVVVRNVYECPDCVTDDDRPVRKTAREKRIIERSIATPSLLAHVFMGKYQRHTPHSQHSHSRESLKRRCEGHERKCYMWLVRGGLEHPMHSYNFRWTRSGKNVIPFLEGFNGNVIQSDGYAGYDAAVNLWNENHPEHKIELCNCNIHARRKFADSVKTTKSKTAEQAVRLYSKIFHEEKELREKYQKNLITEERYLELRKENVLPLFESFHEWLLEKSEREQILGSSKTADAIKYTLGRWDKLIKFLNYSFVSPDTNAAERAVKPFVMVRKNFLFSGSGKGAESSCFLFSLIETAKFNGKTPEDYLRCLFEQAPYAETVSDWEKLLPWNIEITPFQIRGEWMDLANQG